MDNSIEVPDEVRESLSMAADGDIEALAEATWWALINGKEALGLEWFEDLRSKASEPSGDPEMVEFEESRAANLLSNFAFLKLASNLSDKDAKEALDFAATYSPEAAFAPVLIAARNGDQKSAQEILQSLSRELIGPLKEIYSGVCAVAEEDENLDSWFVNWSKDALKILESIPPLIDPSAPNPSPLSPNLKMVAIKSINLYALSVYFEDPLSVDLEEEGKHVEAKIGLPCWAHVSKLMLDDMPVGVVVIPYMPAFSEFIDELEAFEYGAEIPLGAFLTEELIEAGAFSVGNLTTSSQVLVSGCPTGTPEEYRDADSDLVEDCAGDFTVAIFTTDLDFCDGIVMLLRSDLAESLSKYIKAAIKTGANAASGL